MPSNNKPITEFTDFQRWFINVLSYCPVSLTTVEKDIKHHKYQLVPAGWIRTLLYIVIASNTLFKFVYLVLVVSGHFGPVDFLDKMAAMLWILMCIEILQELLFWAKTYPLFEVLSTLWNVENDIYNKLGSPFGITKKSYHIHLYTFVLHTIILVVGCFCIGGQFLSDPKYAVYSYSGFKVESTFLLTIFTVHEVIFMWQAWTGYLSIVTVSSLNAVELTFIMNGMSQAVRTLKHKSPFDPQTLARPKTQTIWNVELGDIVRTTSVKKSKTTYNIETIMADYKKLMLTSDLLNQWCGYRIVGVHFIGYCQFISDVFMMIRLMRLTEMDLPTVMWYAEDATACLYMIFRMFSLMSMVTPASENFMREVQHFLRFDSPMRKRWIRMRKTMRLVSLKLGPSPVKPGTVGAAVMMLMNYYLCVALWK